MFSNLCQMKRFTRKLDIEKQQMLSPDGELIPIVGRSLGRLKNNPVFYLIHLNGAHYTYRLRYPPEFDVFNSSDEPRTISETYRTKVSPQQFQTRAEYDKAIPYVDFVADSIIKMFENKEVIVLFTSDHSEDVYDNPKRLTGDHGDSLKTDSTVKIPFVIWASHSFNGKHALDYYYRFSFPQFTSNRCDIMIVHIQKSLVYFLR